MKKQRLWIFRLITFILLPALLLGILEAAARLLAPGHSTAFITRTTVDGRIVCRENEKFAWQFFPAEIARQPLPLAFTAEKSANTYRIFVLGASAAQGDPEPTFGFSRILERMLEHRYPEVDFEVINTSVTAVNSHAVQRIAREIAPFQGDLFIVYLGNNEVVGPYGAGTVFGPLAPSLPFIRFLMFSRSSHVAQNLARVLRLLQPEQADREKWRGMEMFLDRQVRADDPRLENVYSHFQTNLEDILSSIRRTGAKAMVSTLGTNLRDSAPFSSQHRHPFAEREREKWDGLYQEGLALAEAGRHAEATAQFLAADEIDGTHAALQFLLGRSLGQMGDHREAQRRYRLARDLDALRFRADSRINAIIREVAADRTAEGVFLVDAAREFEASSPHGIPGDDLFHEHVHMNFRGNYLLAKSLLREMERVVTLEADLSHQEGSQALTLEECAHSLALTGFDRHRISKEVLQRLSKPPFTNQIDHAERFERAQRLEQESRTFTTRLALLEAAQQYEQALKRKRDDPWLHHNFGMLLYAAGDLHAAAEQFRIFLARLPHHAVARERLLASLVRLGRFDEAADQSREALRVRPDLHAARYTLAIAFSKTGRVGDAIDIYRELLKVDPDRAPDVYNELGQLHIQQAQYAAAIEAFAEGIRLRVEAGRSESPDMNFNLGVALKREGRIPEAKQVFSRAVAGYLEEIRRNPGSARLHFALGNVHVEMREYRKADESFRTAVAYDPADLQARIHLARSLEAQGRLHEAVEVLRTGVDEMLRLGRRQSAEALQTQQRSLEARIRPGIEGSRRK